MITKDFKRKLTAILSADVKGYSRLMGEDEEATVRAITSYRDVIANIVQKHRGRVVDSPGDNILSEFASVVDAVQGAVKIQEELKVRNAELPENRRMDFRIGVNLGDVIHEEERIYGDGVNVAARIESIAEAGGICISGSTFEQVRNKLPLGYEYLGEHSVKNITEPVSVYRVLMKPEDAGKVIGKKKERPERRKWLTVATVVSILVVAAVAIWNFYFKPVFFSEKVEIEEKLPTSLTEKPSIAVLPFKNLGGDPEQEYFSDGITNDIITDLSKFSELSVIASNTVFTYKNKPVKIKDVSRDLNVRYVLEGSVQKIGDRLRINSQLIDANADRHLWAERYDKDLQDLFKLQSEIVQTIVSKMAIQIEETERARVMRKDTDNLKAYDYLLRGQQHYYQNTLRDNKEARLMFQQAIEIDPRYSMAYAALAWTHINDFLYGWTMFPDKSLQRAADLAKKALNFESSNALAHSALGYIYVRRTQYDLAIIELQRALELNPNDTRSQSTLGSVMLYSGQTKEAIYWKESALRLNPHYGRATYMTLAQAYYLSGRYNDAIIVLKKGVAEQPDFVGNYIMLAAAYAQVGLTKEAKRSAATVLQLHPFFETESYGTVFRNPKDRTKLIDGLKRAGLH